MWVLIAQCWGDNTRTRLMTSVLKEPRKSPGGRPMLRTTGGWGLRCIDLGWTVSGDTGPR